MCATLPEALSTLKRYADFSSFLTSAMTDCRSYRWESMPSGSGDSADRRNTHLDIALHIDLRDIGLCFWRVGEVFLDLVDDLRGPCYTR